MQCCWRVFVVIKGRLNADTSPQNFWTTFLANDLTEKFKKSAVANAIAIPLPLCFSCFVLLRRFRENLTKPFYLYLSRTCGSPGGTPSVISIALRRNVTVLLYRQHRRKTRKHVCGILTHHDSTGSSVCENSVSLPSDVVKPWTNSPTRLQFDDYLFILLWNDIIDVWKCVFLYRPVKYNSVFYISAMSI